jgi:hypothetical protein
MPPLLFRAFLRILIAFSRSSSVMLLVRRTAAGFFGWDLGAAGHGIKPNNCTSTAWAPTSAFSRLVVVLRSLVGNGGVLIVKFRVEGAPIVATSAALGKGVVHAVAGLRAVLDERTERVGAFGAGHGRCGYGSWY